MIDLLIVPVAGMSGNDPDSAGKKRLAAAVNQVFHQGRAKAVAIIGGRSRRRSSWAAEYDRYFREIFPEAAGTLVLGGAYATCTSRDLVSVAPMIRGYLQKRGVSISDAQLGVVSYHAHAKRAAIVLHDQGFRWAELVDSGEKPAYSPCVESVLTNVTYLDPGWRHLGLPLVMLADHRFQRDDERR